MTVPVFGVYYIAFGIGAALPTYWIHPPVSEWTEFRERNMCSITYYADSEKRLSASIATEMMFGSENVNRYRHCVVNNTDQ